MDHLQKGFLDPQPHSPKSQDGKTGRWGDLPQDSGANRTRVPPVLSAPHG